MLTKEELQFLTALKKKKNPFLIVGLSAAVLQGALVGCIACTESNSTKK